MSIQKINKISDKRTKFFQKLTQTGLKCYIANLAPANNEDINPSEFIIFLLLLLSKHKRMKNYADSKFIKSLAAINRIIESKKSKFPHLMKNIKIWHCQKLYFSADIDQVYADLYDSKIIYFTNNNSLFEFNLGSNKIADLYIEIFITRFGLTNVPRKEINSIAKNFITFYTK